MKLIFIYILLIFVSGCQINYNSTDTNILDSEGEECYDTSLEAISEDECISQNGVIVSSEEGCGSDKTYIESVAGYGCEHFCCKPIPLQLIECQQDLECLRASVGNDPLLQQIKYPGEVKGNIGWKNRTHIDIACMSKKYYDENKEEYNLTTDVYTSTEANCLCQDGLCQEVMYGVPLMNS